MMTRTIFDEIVTNLSDHPKSVVLLLTNKMKIPKSNYQQFNNFHQVFAGGGSPTIDDMFKTFHVPNTNISVHWIFCTSTRFNQNVPLSTGCFDIKFHEIQVIPEFIDIIKNADGRKGLFPTRIWVLCPVVLSLDSQESFSVDSCASCLSVFLVMSGSPCEPILLIAC